MIVRLLEDVVQSCDRQAVAFQAVSRRRSAA